MTIALALESLPVCDWPANIASELRRFMRRLKSCGLADDAGYLVIVDRKLPVVPVLAERLGALPGAALAENYRLATALATNTRDDCRIQSHRQLCSLLMCREEECVGALVTNDYVLTLAGHERRVAEAILLAVAVELDLTSYDEALELVDATNNPHFRSFYICSKTG